jgi:hypothetical protein
MTFVSPIFRVHPYRSSARAQEVSKLLASSAQNCPTPAILWPAASLAGQKFMGLS